MNKIVDFDAKVFFIKEQGSGYGVYQVILEVPESFVSQAKPGMFSVFATRDKTHLLRRPFSISGASYNRLAFLIKNVGPNTDYYVHLKHGDIINISNPRGQSIYIDNKINHYILVAGSIGAAPLIFLAKYLRKFGKRVTVLLGGRNISQIVGVNFFRTYGCEIKIIVEEHELPNVGLVTNLLKEEFELLKKKTSIVTCGSMPMMKAVAEMCKQKQITCQLILESVFACSIGVCSGCVVFMQDKTTRHICVDGPAFWAHELDLNQLNSVPRLCGSFKNK
ncbi:hypothetical protein KAI65_03205 [Candidatus Parcubacteria bacterium]|nr:hypothetical protein [Candidatus Parcubacteria bacterium]